MRTDSTRFYFNRDIRRRAIDITIAQQGPIGLSGFAQPLVFKEPEVEASVIPPTLSISPESTTELMDELWNLGTRPSERYYSGPGDGIAVSAHIASLQAEVVYLRSLVNHHLGIVR